jgi:methyl-accepting chemotaxis protein
MTITRQLNLLVIAIVALFAAMLVFVIINGNTISRLLDLQDQFIELESLVRGLNGTGKDLIASEEDLEDLLEAYAVPRMGLGSALDGIRDNPDLSLLPQEVSEQLRMMRSTWDQVYGELSRSVGSLADLLLDNRLASIRKTGLMAMRLDLAINDPENPRGLYLKSITDILVQGQDKVESILLPASRNIRSQTSDAISSSRDRTNLIILVGSAGIVLFSLAYGLAFARRMKQRVSAVSVIMERAADKDLRRRVEIGGNDEFHRLGQGLNGVLDGLAVFMTEAQRVSSQLYASQDDLAGSSLESTAALNQISTNIQSMYEQFANLSNQISRGAEDIQNIKRELQALNEEIRGLNERVETAAKHSESMNEDIRRVFAISRERQEEAEDLQLVISDGGEQVSSTADIIDEISGEIESILEIIDIINHIADQTNLLSLNAAIESAHAGEAGKGFGVVAAEIQKLAESTGENADRITERLGSITERIHDARRYSRLSREAFGKIQEETGAFTRSLEEIIAQMEQLTSSGREIGAASRDLRESSRTIDARSTRMNESVNSTARAIRSYADFASSLVNGISEIETGARSVLTGITAVQELAESLRRSTEVLGHFLESYVVDEKKPGENP